MTTARGAWLDTVLDRYADVALATGVTLGQLGRTPDLVVWIGAVVAISGFLLASYVTKEFALRHGEDYPNDRLSRLKRRDLRLFGIFLGALAGRPFEALVLVGALSHACVVGILYRGWRAHPA
jgi:phosphatidylglycerophosphate synthase